MVFWIFTPYKIEAYEFDLSDFYADDLTSAMQSAETKIATTQECLAHLEMVYPKYHKYRIEVGKL
jgi:hypothetical protein